MSNIHFTPGPWTARQDCRSYLQHGKTFNGGESPEHSWSIYGESQRVVCVELLPETVRSYRETAANAALIAAAPAMYQLIARINEAFYVSGTAKVMRPVMAETRDLLRMARGEFQLATQPATLPRRVKFHSTPATQRVLLAGLDCAPGQADLFSTDGTN